VGSLIKRLLDTTDPTASMRHFAYLLVIACGCGWLSFSLYRPGLNAEWVTSFGLLLAAVTTGKVMGKDGGPNAV